jgi:glycosyltransferase involved in cell wall biosynthesis
MKILHISTFDIVGGAARATYRLHQGLMLLGHDSKMLVKVKKSDDPSVTRITWKASFISKIWSLLTRIKKEQTVGDGLFSSALTRNPFIIDQIKSISPDIIHLHWVTGSFLGIQDIYQICNLGKPVFWTCQDLWPISGGFHYNNIDKFVEYKSKGGHDPFLKEVYGKRGKYFHIRSEKWKDLFVHFIAPSAWMKNCIESNQIFKRHNVDIIPNSLDEKIFCPVPKAKARQLLNLDIEKHYILFGASNGTEDRRKGFKELNKALEILALDNKYVLLTFGLNTEDLDGISMKKINLGKISNDNELKLVYSAADVFVAPSIQEAFGMTASEAMACGTLVVGFRDTGIADIVSDTGYGYLAIPFSVEDLAKGISYCLEESQNIELLGRASKYSRWNFAHSQAAKRCLNLYSNSTS